MRAPIRTAFLTVLLIGGTWLAPTPAAHSYNEREFTAKDCRDLCKPLPVFSFTPGFCYVNNDKHVLKRCESSIASNIVPIGSVCVCGDRGY